PVGRELVEHLSLERHRADDHVEAADAVAADDRTPAAAHVALAHLAADALAQLRQIRLLQRAFALCLEQSDVHPHASHLPPCAFQRRSTASSTFTSRTVPSSRSISWMPVGLVTLISVSQSPITSMPANTIPCARRSGPMRAQISRSRAESATRAGVPPTWK